MWGRDPRSLMFAAAGLDLAGQLILLLLLVGASSWLPLPLTTDPLALPLSLIHISEPTRRS